MFFLTAALLAVALLFSMACAAPAPTIRDIDISAVLAEDGSAHITEVWDVTVASGTEWYISMKNMEGKKISSLSVHDETGTEYTNEGAWDIDRTIEQKASRCGIVTSRDGYELCWGVGSLGDHVYTVSYTMTNLVTGYDDADGFNHEFITYGLSSPPQHIRVAVSKEEVAFSNDDTKIWAFGFDGEIWIKNGAVVAESTSGVSLSSSSYVDILVQFKKGMFQPALTAGGSFDALRERAMRGSSYSSDTSDSSGGNGNSPGRGVIFAIAAGFIALCFGITTLQRTISKPKYVRPLTRFTKDECKDAPYSRDIPFGGNLPVSFFGLSSSVQKNVGEGALIGAYLLRWMEQGNVTVENHARKGFLGIDMGLEPSIVFTKPLPESADPSAKVLYSILQTAAGDDGILQEKELYKWCRQNYTTIVSWKDRVLSQARATMLQTGDAEFISYTTFLGKKQRQQQDISAQGKQHILEMLGFKRYLQDYTIINERFAEEVGLWDEYLVYASLFGIADQVRQQFQNLYPQYFEQLYQRLGTDPSTDLTDNILLLSTLSSAMQRGAQAGQSAASSSSSGDGGSASSGGGGGHSGGGGGGGSR